MKEERNAASKKKQPSRGELVSLFVRTSFFLIFMHDFIHKSHMQLKQFNPIGGATDKIPEVIY